MSRFNEDGDEDYPNAWALHRQAQRNALLGKKGQAVLRELEAALVALPEKRLIEGSLCRDGEVCALGALARRRGVLDEEMERMDGDEAWIVAEWATDTLGVVHALATAVQYQNDEGDWAVYVQNGGRESPEQRYERVLGWARACLAKGK